MSTYLDGPPKLGAVDEEPAHESVPGQRLRKADRATYQPLNLRSKIDVSALDFLGMGLAHCVLREGKMALVGPPPSGGEAVDAKRLTQLSALQKDDSLTPPQDVRKHGPTGVWITLIPLDPVGVALPLIFFSRVADQHL